MYSYHNGLILHRSSRPFNRGSVPPCLHIATVILTVEGIAIGILVAYPLTNNVGNGFLEFAALSQRRQPLIYTSYYTMPRVKVKLETTA